MEKYKRYTGVLLFLLIIALLIFGAYKFITPKFTEVTDLKEEVETLNSTLDQKKQQRDTVMRKIANLKRSLMNSQKRIYSPVESNLDNDTLFFTMYNDVIEMLHANSVKIQSIKYEYNPKADRFVENNKDDIYFVCDVNLELVSNYINLGKFIQDIYQYPYYIKINNIDTEPYAKDKKILLSKISLRLYAHTNPEEEDLYEDSNTENQEGAPLNGAEAPLPQ